jgi:solute carrier family 35 (UDP-galactose transporter), member B1
LVWPAKVEDKTHYGYYMGCALSYLLAVVTSTKALEWVAYPTQVVSKSAKPIPVIILGKLIGKKSYTYRKYFFVVLIVIGVILFMYKDGKNSHKESQNLGWGEALLLFSLCMDGVLGAIEVKLKI